MPALVIHRAEVEAALDAADIDPEDASIRTDYSGRGMFGRTSAAVTLPSPTALTPFLTALCLEMAGNGRADTARALAAQTNTDSMGRGIIAYWPDVAAFA